MIRWDYPLARAWLPMVVVMAVAGALPRAQEGDNQVALVISSSQGTVVTRCVGFDEAEITGYEALTRSGIEIAVDPQGGSAAVCAVDGTGCPSDDCFCRCRGGDACVYWSYWHLKEEEWQYAVAGASVYTVRHGDVEGWSWGPGSVTEAIPPPVYTFEDICSVPPLASGVSATEVATADLAASGSEATILQVPATTAGAGPELITGAEAEAAPANESSFVEPGGAGISYLAFGVILAALLAFAVLARGRRRGGL